MKRDLQVGATRHSFEGIFWAFEILLGTVWLLILVYQSTNTTIVQDEVGHFILSKQAWNNPMLLLDNWGRFGTTLYFMPIGHFSLMVARVFSAISLALIVVLSSLAAKSMNLESWWLLPACVYLQPWTFQFLYATTVVPFTLAMSAAVLAWHTRRFKIAGFCLGMLPLIRHEGIALVAFGMLISTVGKHKKAALVMFAPIFAFNLIRIMLLGQSSVGLLIDIKPTDEYGSGGWLHFAPGIFEGVGFLVLSLVLAGCVATAVVNRLPWVVWTFPVYMFVHVVIFRFGLFASGGYIYFLLPMAIFFALMATVGIAWIDGWWANKVRAPIILLYAAAAVGVGYGIIQVVRTPLPTVDRFASACEDARDRLQSQTQLGRVYATHVWCHYYLGLPQQAPGLLWWATPTPDEMQAGDVYIWDEQYSSAWRRPKELFENQSGIRKSFEVGHELVVYTKR